MWQIRKAELEAAQSELTASKTYGKTSKDRLQDPFTVGPAADPGYVPPIACSTCGTPVSPGKNDCDVCRYKAEAKRNANNGDIVISQTPFAIIDRKF